MSIENQNLQVLFNQEQLHKLDLPEGLRDTYRILSFLKYGKEKKTLLLQSVFSGERFILKIASGSGRGPLLAEEKILHRLREQGITSIPKPIMTLEDKTRTYFLREYIEGYTPKYVVEKSGPYGEQDLLLLMMKVCDAVCILHQMEEPVIHRDIKPENLIIRLNGSVNLIDMETARVFSDEKEHDTIQLGTSTTAAPEQYGYAQTDIRSDIYAMGMTMLYLATGYYNRNELAQTGYSAKLRKVILKCCSFDPNQRYQNVMELKKALAACTVKAKQKHILYACTGILVCLVIVFSVFHFNEIQRQRESAAIAVQTVVFSNSVLEQEVRKELGFDKNRTITYDDLKNVHRIALIGYEEVPRNAELAYRDGAYLDDVDMKEKGGGSISDISLLAYMPNLYELILCQQMITDITPLKGLPITRLVLADNKIKDLSPIGELPELTELYIGNNPAADMEPVGKCTKLRLLNMDRMAIKNLDFLSKLSLDNLSVSYVKLDNWDWTPITTQTTLRRYATSDLNSEQAAAINQLTGLYELASWWNSKLPDLTELDGLVNLRTLIILDGFKSLKGIEKMQQLTDLFIGYNSIKDLSLIKELPNLRVLGMDDTVVEDFSVLFKCPSLTKVMHINERQKNSILKINPDPSFKIETKNESAIE